MSQGLPPLPTRAHEGATLLPAFLCPSQAQPRKAPEAQLLGLELGW